jgi:O-antigen ligase
LLAPGLGRASEPVLGAGLGSVSGVASEAALGAVSGAGRDREMRYDAVMLGWALLVCLAMASVFTEYATYRVVFDSSSAFWVEIRDYLSRYVFERPNLELSTMLVAASTYVDGLLVVLVIVWNIEYVDVRSLLWTMAASGVVVALFGFYQADTRLGLATDWTINDPDIVRINATYSDPNALASYFALLIPLTIGLGAAEAGRRRLFWAGAAGVMGIALVMTAGRGGLLGAIGGLAILLVAALRLRLHEIDPSIWVRRYYRPAFWLVTGLAAVLVCMFVVLGTAFDIRHFEQRSYLDTWLYTFNLRQRPDLIAKGRFSIWQTAWLMIKDYPIFGIGVGRIFRMFAGYNRLVDGAFEDARFSAHNTFLNVAAELGVVGLIIWLALLAATFAAGWRAVRQAAARDGGAAWLALALVAGLGGYTLTMMTGDRLVLREDVVVFAAASAAMVVLSRTERASGAPAPTPPRRTASGAPAPTPPRRTASGAPAAKLFRINLAAVGTLAAVVIVASIPIRVVAERQRVRLDRVVHGLFDVEQRDPAFRWTRGQAVFYTPMLESSLTMAVRAAAPFSQTVDIRLDGVNVDRLTLGDHEWHRVTYTLPRHTSDVHGYHRIDLAITPTWRPSDDGRELGVMLAWPVTVVPRQ